MGEEAAAVGRERGPSEPGEADDRDDVHREVLDAVEDIERGPDPEPEAIRGAALSRKTKYNIHGSAG